ncbi:hypothetical protein LCGC14_2807040, partial [marine sediment metagenome]
KLLQLVKQEKIAEEAGFTTLASLKHLPAKAEMLRRYDASSDPNRRATLLAWMDGFDPDGDVDRRLKTALYNEAMKPQWPRLIAQTRSRRNWKDFFDKVCSFLEHKDRVVAEAAWEAVRYSMDDRPVPDPIIRRLLAGRDVERARWALLVVYVYNDNDLAKFLQGALTNDKAEVVALALGMIAKTHIRDDLDAKVPSYQRNRSSRARSMGMFGRRRAKPEVRDHLPKGMVDPVLRTLVHTSAAVRTRAAALLYRSGARKDEKVRETLRAGLKDSDAARRRVAMAGIAKDAKGFLKDFDLIAAAKSPETSTRAVEIMAFLEDPKHTPILIEIAKDKDSARDRTSLLKALVRSADDRALEAAKAIFVGDGSSYAVRSFAEEYLAGMKGAGAVKFVQWALSNADDTWGRSE